jgi:hypothetical protein
MSVLSLVSCGGDDSPPTTNVPNSVLIADFNADGIADVAAATTAAAADGSTPNPGFASIFLQSRSELGSFSGGKHFPTGNNPSSGSVNYTGFGQPLGVAVGDLNNDGHPDIAVADGTTATMMLQSTTTPGTFASGVQIGN